MKKISSSVCLLLAGLGLAGFGFLAGGSVDASALENHGKAQKEAAAREYCNALYDELAKDKSFPKNKDGKPKFRCSAGGLGDENADATLHLWNDLASDEKTVASVRGAVGRTGGDRLTLHVLDWETLEINASTRQIPGIVLFKGEARMSKNLLKEKKGAL